MNPFDSGWTDIGLSWEQELAALDPALKARVEAHARQLMETGYRERTALFVALEIHQDAERTKVLAAAEAAKAGRRVIEVTRRDA